MKQSIFKLVSLTVKNFLSIKYAKVPLSKPGLYLINGYNMIGGDSNGSGKSALLASIPYACFGKTPGGLTGNEVENWEVKGADYFAELDLSGPEGIYTIHRGSDGLRFTINGKPVKGRKKDVQSLINETLNSTDDVFFSSTLFTSNMSDYLVKMGDAAKKRLFKAILRLEKLDQAYDKTKTKLDKKKEEATDLENSIDTHKASLDAWKTNLSMLKRQIEDFEETKAKRLKEFTKDDKPEYSNVAFEMKAKTDRLKELNDILETLEKENVGRNKEIDKLLEESGKKASEISTMEVQLKEALELEGQTQCTKCGSTFVIEDYKKWVSAYRWRIGNAWKEYSEIRADISRLQDKNQEIEVFRRSAESLANELDYLVEKYQEEELRMKLWEERNKAIQDSIEEIKNSPNPYINLALTAEEETAKCRAKLDEETLQFNSIVKEIDYLAYLKMVFSREGVGSQIIESSFGSIQSIANRYLSKICSEGLLINIVPQRELKSKALKEEIDIFVTSNSRPSLKINYDSLSAGQQQRVNIAILLALYRFCRNIGINSFDFLVLDEVLDLSLGNKGQEDVVSLLRDILQEIGQVFVVSHKEALMKDFDYEIQVVRELDGFTKVL